MPNRNDEQFRIVGPTKLTDTHLLIWRMYHPDYNEPIGELTVHADPLPPLEENAGYHPIDLGHIHPDFRGQGLYMHLVDRAAHDLKGQGSRGVVSIGVDRNNAANAAWAKEHPAIKQKPAADLVRPSRKEVATIAVINSNKILMARRSDNNKWTTPGGHLEPGEHPYQAAIRELAEEAGIKNVTPAYLGFEDVVGRDGAVRRIHCFVVRGHYRTDVLADPDKETKRWEWVSFKDGLAHSIHENLHSTKNVLLKKLGLQVW
jgi:8-oxo-dGTP pyrophosphatase MutT (NUDIX family)/GNAT superfamily N-acetyltransferase